MTSALKISNKILYTIKPTKLFKIIECLLYKLTKQLTDKVAKAIFIRRHLKHIHSLFRKDIAYQIIHLYMCLSECLHFNKLKKTLIHLQPGIYSLTQTYIYIYIYIYMCVCVAGRMIDRF